MKGISNFVAPAKLTRQQSGRRRNDGGLSFLFDVGIYMLD